MKRVLVVGTVVALGDGTVLGTALALGWTATAVVALVVGILGAVVAAMLTPAPRTATQSATVTLGLPIGEQRSREDEVDAAAEGAPTPGVGSTPSPVAA